MIIRDTAGNTLFEDDNTNLSQTLQNARNQGVSLAHANLAGVQLKNADLDGLDLNHANLSHASLHTVSLRYAEMEQVRFDDATLTNCNLGRAFMNHSTFRSATIHGCALQGAFMENAHCQDATLTECQAVDARMPRINMDGATLKSCIFDQTTMNGASLKQCHLEMVSLCNLEARAANFARSWFNHCHLDSAKLQGSIFNDDNPDHDLPQGFFAALGGEPLLNQTVNAFNVNGSLFSDTDFTRTRLDNARLGKSTFINAKLHHTKFTNADLTGAQFEKTFPMEDEAQTTTLTSRDEPDWFYVCCVNAQMNGITIKNCDLKFVDFFQAQLQGTNLRRVKSIERTFMSGANLSHAKLDLSACRAVNFDEANADQAEVKTAGASDRTINAFRNQVLNQNYILIP
ncbi:pentapeptide repeat-containing protein [Sneathiella chinensis]|uniref:Pentapeptide repeat-containing protein n=1 Tax=Sneathiella chinensis TaxID=349750 RepID=A0ABQ5U4P7_9PROT|nr:pentapeptide repeat-containing protein [Sneathiella chinensis]GLQ07114.1 hypothetical protein GCM10007924_23350 [Sneathiella chinensis]